MSNEKLNEQGTFYIRKYIKEKIIIFFRISHILFLMLKPDPSPAHLLGLKMADISGVIRQLLHGGVMKGTSAPL